ncbi:MAG: hypothetical protein E6J90_50135 [Deltaproteobacteria bacterium]|nr:MAG: hypothetical protein E6J90_50135 [Deltaproteobacteria bacterium]
MYIAFDYDDRDVKENLVAQSKLPECPFEIVDSSILQQIPQDWVSVARRLISGSECVLVLCGEQTHQARGVAIELQIAQELGKRYFLLRGTRKGTPTRPRNARASDPVWTFRWPTIHALLDGRTPPDEAAY